VGRRYQTEINLNLLARTKTAHAAGFQNTQQLNLQGRRHIPDLIEEKRPLMGLFEATDLTLVRAGKRTFFMSEQFGLEQFRGNSRTVHGNHRSGAATDGMNCLGNQFLTGTSFALNQHGRFGLTNNRDVFLDLHHCRAFARDDAIDYTLNG
jgi:hypothetical protein